MAVQLYFDVLVLELQIIQLINILSKTKYSHHALSGTRYA
jgi:hypothetical protein